MNRREFLEKLAVAGATIPLTLSLVGCPTDGYEDDDDDSGLSNDGCSVGDASGNSNSHGHSVTIPVDHIENPDDDRTYSTSGGHLHTITITADELAELRDNCTVTIETTNLHTHTWIISID